MSSVRDNTTLTLEDDWKEDLATVIKEMHGSSWTGYTDFQLEPPDREAIGDEDRRKRLPVPSVPPCEAVLKPRIFSLFPYFVIVF